MHRLQPDLPGGRIGPSSRGLRSSSSTVDTEVLRRVHHEPLCCRLDAVMVFWPTGAMSASSSDLAVLKPLSPLLMYYVIRCPAFVRVKLQTSIIFGLVSPSSNLMTINKLSHLAKLHLMQLLINAAKAGKAAADGAAVGTHPCYHC